jgi:hypothetical protein
MHVVVVKAKPELCWQVVAADHIYEGIDCFMHINAADFDREAMRDRPLPR